MTGTPACFARRRSAAVAFAADNACGKSRSPPSNSRSLIQSMRSSATGLLSGAAPCKSLLLERGIERGGERNIAAHEVLPCNFDAFALALGHELHAFRADRQHVGLAVELELTPERPFQLGRHGPWNAISMPSKGVGTAGPGQAAGSLR